ncbi:MAG TPA: ABC transporter ATP-binding protein [Verrucomicrobiae bacterium]|nr:ABC transporter ATP-binding protein [Verrucomicrobiae bacterium]
MASITVSHLTKVFPNGVRALQDVDLEIRDGEFFALLGPSGCGKTTLLRTLAGLEVPAAGQVRIGDRDVTRLPPGARRVAMVFQDYALYPHMDVVDNIAYPLKIQRVARVERRQRAAETGANLGLQGMMDRRPAQLSGGQQQRVALARAVASHPQVFLFDEPLSNLDARLRMEARTFLKRLHAEVRTTTVYVTHDQAEALALADRMAVMEGGRIRQVGSPVDVFHRPANLFVASFIGGTPMNLLDAVVEADGVRVGADLLPLPPSARGLVAVGDRVVLGARPEYAELHHQPVAGGLSARIAIIEHLGTAYLVDLESPAGPLQVVVPEDEPPTAGVAVWVTAHAARSLLYRRDTGELIGTGAPAARPAAAVPAAGADGSE